MNKLLEAFVRDGIVLGENGMPARKDSGSKLLDAFYKLGAARVLTDAAILQIWRSAWAESQEGTLRMAFFNRDIRGGQGERRTFRIFWAWLCAEYPVIAIANIPNVPFFGRWDDLWSIPELKGIVWEAIADFVFVALLNGDKLCGKWMPREGKAKSDVANRFIQMWGMTPKAYRKLCASNTEVIESLMCAGNFGKINYSHVPSQAAKKYRKAFFRRDEVRYRKYLADLVKGVKGVKVNAGAIYPHEVLMPLYGYHPTKAEIDLANSQWKALPEITGEDEAYLPMVDTSGSMSGIPIQVSLALGLFLAERNRSVFNNCFITFSNRPKFQHLKGETVYERLRHLDQSGWDMNTNFLAAMDLILNTAVANKVPAKDMPTALIVLSDMQFDQAGGDQCTLRAMQLIDKKYEKAGYVRPKIIYWNLRDAGNVPVKYDEAGTALVSGYSPNIMSTVFKGSNPLQVLIATLGAERYDRVVI